MLQASVMVSVFPLRKVPGKELGSRGWTAAMAMAELRPPRAPARRRRRRGGETVGLPSDCPALPQRPPHTASLCT